MVCSSAKCQPDSPFQESINCKTFAPDAMGTCTFPSRLLFSELLQKTHKQNGRKLTKRTKPQHSWRPGAWKESQAEPHWVCRAEVASPETSGHVGSEKGGAGHLKNIYMYCTCPYEASFVGTEVRPGSVSGGHGSWAWFLLPGPAFLQGSLAWPARTPQLAIIFWGRRGS